MSSKTKSSMQFSIRTGGIPIWVLLVVVVAAAVTVRTALIRYTGSDTRGALLTSQTLLRTGSFRLDHLGGEAESYGYRIHEHRGHLYYFFPIGSPLLAVPLSALAGEFGSRVDDPATDRRLQIVLASATVAFAAGLLMVWAGRRTSVGTATVVTCAFIWGSSVMSTGATAYWSSNWAVVLNLAALLLLAGGPGEAGNRRLVLLGTLLFWSYLCRPTGALPIAVVAGLLITSKRARAWPYFVTVAAWAALFVGWSLAEFGEPLPAYYLPGRIESSGLSRAALVGHLVSPSRGLLVHSPFLLAVIGGLLMHWRRFVRSPLSIACAAWLGLHWLAVSQFPHWWAGHSFGARLWTEALPAAAGLTIAVARWMDAEENRCRRRIWLAAFSLLAMAAVFINTSRGLFHDPSSLWNRNPNVDHHPEYLSDWRYPQFLATDESNNRRFLETQRGLPALESGVPASATARELSFSNWNPPERSGGRTYRWSRGPRPLVVFSWSAGEASEAPTHLLLELGSFGQQEVQVVLNGREIATIDAHRFAPSRHELALPADWPAPDPRFGGLQVLEFHVVDPKYGHDNSRRIGISFWGLELTRGNGM